MADLSRVRIPTYSGLQPHVAPECNVRLPIPICGNPEAGCGTFRRHLFAIVQSAHDFARSLNSEGKFVYAAFSVSQTGLEEVCQYISASHHQKLTFQDELRALLRAHGMDVDEQYLWD